jgi:molybdate transport system substrate-binding protein
MSDGKTWEIPADMHPPIEQAAILLNGAKSNNAARTFLDFVKSAAGRETLVKFGFAVPVAARP